MKNTSIKVSFESRLSSLPILRKFIRGICSAIIDSEQCLQDIDLGINEAISNVICHAYQKEEGQEIEIRINFYSNYVIFQIIDSGLKKPEIQEASLPNEDFTKIETLSESGRGLFLIQSLMDEVIYKNEEGKNILLLRKYFNQPCELWHSL